RHARPETIVAASHTPPSSARYERWRTTTISATSATAYTAVRSPSRTARAADDPHHAESSVQPSSSQRAPAATTASTDRPSLWPSTSATAATQQRTRASQPQLVGQYPPLSAATGTTSAS